MDATLVVVLLIAAIVLVAVGAIVYVRQRRSKQLQEQFGPEYEQAVGDYGGKGRGERVLAERAERVKGFELVSLPPAERSGFANQWRDVQARFVDEPPAAIGEANRLVTEVMLRRGYPMGDFEQRAADVSVDHPGVVSDYRAARTIALQNERGEADTEALRQAMVHYRSLFEDLLEERVDAQRPQARRATA